MSVETTLTRDTVAATGIVTASPSEVFEFLRRPANHAALSGDGTVRGTKGPEVVLGPDDSFKVAMKQYGIPYTISSSVVEFTEDRRIAWAHLGKHRWRWEIEPTDDGSSRVTETFDLSTALAPWVLRTVMGMPKAHEENVRRSVQRLQEQFVG